MITMPTKMDTATGNLTRAASALRRAEKRLEKSPGSHFAQQVLARATETHDVACAARAAIREAAAK